MDRELLLRILINLPALVLAVSFHEAAHAWSASRLGDPTAKLLGRVSLNPIRHIDVVGSVIIPLFLSFAGGFMFGWAKPVPVDVSQLGNPRRDNALVSAAGPASNLLQALIASVLMRLVLFLPESFQFFTQPLISLMTALIFINVILAVFNLIPIPPLDGSHVLAAFLPDEWAERFEAIGMYGMAIILILFIMDPLKLGIWTKFIQPIVMRLVRLFLFVAGIG